MKQVHMMVPAGHHRALCEPWNASDHASWSTKPARDKPDDMVKITTSRMDLVTCRECKKLGRG